MFLEIESDVCDDLNQAKLVLGLMLREHQDAARMKLIEILRK